MKKLVGLAFLQLCGSALLCLCHALTGDEVISATGITSGFTVHVGCGDGSITTGLSNEGAILVHGLADTEDDLEAARSAVVSQGLAGIVAVEKHSDWSTLPYARNTANLVVADLDALSSKGLSIDEIKRILAPETGVAYVKQSGSWTQTTKPRPSGMDDWTHRDYDETAHLVSQDKLVQPPNSLKWKSGYLHGPDKILTMRLAGGRLFYEWPHSYKTADGKRFRNAILVGRDAFNGALLWDKRLDTEVGKYRAFVVDEERLYIDFMHQSNDERFGGPLQVLDALTGNTLRTLNDKAKSDHLPMTMDLSLAGDTLIQICRDSLFALNSLTGEQYWVRTEGVPRTGTGNDNFGTGAFYCCPAVDRENQRFFVGVAETLHKKAGRIVHWYDMIKILCLDLKTGNTIWESKPEELVSISQLSYVDGRLGMYFATNNNAIKELPQAWYMSVLDASTGEALWEHSRDWYQSDLVDNGNKSSREFWIRNDSYFLTNAHYLLDIDKTTGELNKLHSRGTGSNGARCNRSIATNHFMMIGGMLYIDYDKKVKMLQEAVRSACGTGPFVANGMVYFTPNKCECFEQMGGYSAYYSDVIEDPLPVESRLEQATKGYALSVSPAIKPSFAGTAPTGEYVPSAIDLWREPYSERDFWLSMPVARDWMMNDEVRALQTEPVQANGMEYVALIHEHRLEARKNGEIQWYFLTGGRISTPPIFYEGLCIFGSHDGYVYACDAVTGEMKYRFMAAPNHKKILVHSQVESSWPVYGVIEYGGSIYFTAGRHPDVDGGIYLYQMEPQTGAIVGNTVIRRNRQWQPMDDKYLPRTVGVRNGRLKVRDGKLVLVRSLIENSGSRPWENTTHGMPGFYLDPATGEMVMDGENYEPEDYQPFPPVGNIRPKRSRNQTARKISISGNSFYVPEKGRAEISVYAVSGRRIARAFNRIVDAGSHTYALPVLPGGYYIVELHLDNLIESKSILVVE